jgi:hypothetical protein
MATAVNSPQAQPTKAWKDRFDRNFTSPSSLKACVRGEGSNLSAYLSPTSRRYARQDRRFRRSEGGSVSGSLTPLLEWRVATIDRRRVGAKPNSVRAGSDAAFVICAVLLPRGRRALDSFGPSTVRAIGSKPNQPDRGFRREADISDCGSGRRFWGHRRIFPKEHAKGYPGIRRADFVGA